MEKRYLNDYSWRFRLFRIACRALFPDNSDSAEDMVAIPDFEDLPDLFGDRYSSPSNYFRKEWDLFLVKLNGHVLVHLR